MKNILIGLLLTAMALTLSACETMKGLGQDMENAGEWIGDRAEAGK
jgi:predicted small secreted protein